MENKYLKASNTLLKKRLTERQGEIHFLKLQLMIIRNKIDLILESTYYASKRISIRRRR